jgi:hypothetical protein
VTIHTPASLRTSRRRVDRRITKAAFVLAAMQNGCSLNLQFTRNGPRWALSDGRQVSNEIAEFVTGSASGVPVGDCLFAGAASQTWRWWSNDPCK